MTAKRPSIYLDHSATTSVRAEVVEAMRPYFDEFYGNPSSIHGIGRRANSGLDGARRTLADLLGAHKNEIIFTGCGTESDNAALRGIAHARRKESGANRIVTTAIEHKAVLETARDLGENYGFDLTLLPVDGDGLVAVADVEAALGEDVAVVSVMYANNEIGTIQPIPEIGAACRERGIPFHTDAVQAAGKLPLSVEQLNVDALSTSAHKFHGPKGIGFLYLRRGTPCLPTITGGTHEGSRRAGTENVPGAVGMATALALAESERAEESPRLQTLRDRLIEGILEGVEGAHLTGHRTRRLPNHASFVLDAVEAEGVLIGLDLAGIAASSGSACMSAAQKPSHVLEAIGIPPLRAAGGLRLSLGRNNTREEIEYVLQTLPRVVDQIKGAVPIAL